MLPRNSLTVQMKGGKQNLERVFQFIFLSMALCASVFFFRRRFKSTEYSNRMVGSIFVKNMAYRTTNCLLNPFFIFLEG